MKPLNQSLRKKKKYKFEIGDYVRISHTKKAFSREYDQRWTGELFKVVDRCWKQEHPTYTLHDYAGDTVEGTFYEEELQKVIPFYSVEKVLKRRQRRGHPKEVLARWLHWPPKYDSWIPESHLRDYKSHLHHLTHGSRRVNMSLQKYRHVLKVLSEGNKTTTIIVLKEAGKNLLTCLSECAHNILQGNVPLGVIQKWKIALATKVQQLDSRKPPERL